MRSHGEVARFFEGMDLVEPGVWSGSTNGYPPGWPDQLRGRCPAHHWGGLARKPWADRASCRTWGPRPSRIRPRPKWSPQAPTRSSHGRATSAHVPIAEW